MGDTVNSNQDEVYREQATRWLIEVIAVSIFAGVLNFVLSALLPNFTYLLLSLILILGLALINTLLLFRHIDTLILKRLAAVQEETHV